MRDLRPWAWLPLRADDCLMDADNNDSAGLERLDREECYVLLKSVPIGRIVFTEGALPAIQPVNFAVDGDDIVIRTRSGSKLAAAARSAIVAFEVDEYDAEHFTGWSVVAVGRAHGVADSEELEHLRTLNLTPWALGDRPHFIRITPDLIRGRRIPPAVPAV